MSLDRFINKSSLLALNRSSNGQLWTNEDLEILDEQVLVPVDPNIANGQISEVHILSFYGDYILGNHNAGYTFHDQASNSLLIDIGKVFKEANIQKGSYIITLNLFQELWGGLGRETFFVKEISPNRDEIHFKVDKKFLNEFEPLKAKIQNYIDNGTLNNVVINFGYNRIQKIINIRFEDDGFYVKFYLPIYDDIIEKNKAWIQFEVTDPYVDTVVLAPPISKGFLQSIKGPNFDLDTSLYSSNGTDFKNWNQLLDANLTTQQRIIEASLSGSGLVQLNIDYSDFNNFVFYGSAEERTRNFHYKVSKIEEYSSSIEILLNSTASNTLFISSSVDINRNRINEITSNFDPWEKWLYFQSTASIFSHDITGSIRPYPKRLVSGSWKNYTLSSSNVQTWYNELVTSASDYDKQNMNRLWWSVPEHVIMEPGNSDFVLFVDMVGHHFDILYSYVNALTQIHERDEHPQRGTPNELLYSIAKSFGWQLQNTRQLDDLWKYKLGQTQQGTYEYSGSMFSLSSENQTHQIWRRIVNNLPYLYKTKGTPRSLKALMSIYGIPQTLISIKEYGGPSPREGSKPTLIEDRFIYKANFTGSNWIELPRRSIPNTSGSWGGVTRVPDSIVFRFNTEYSSSVSQSLWAIENGQNRTQVLSNLELVHIRAQTGTSSYSGSNAYGFLRLTQAQLSGSTFISHSSQTSYLPLFDDDSWSVHLYATSSIETSGSIFVKVQRTSDSLYGRIAHSSSLAWSGSWNVNAAWGTGSLNYILLGGTTGSNSSRFVGQIDGYKEYFETLEGSVFDAHTLNPSSYQANTETGSYYKLFRYFPLGLDQQRWDHSTYLQVSSSHPNRVANFDTTASFKNWSGSQQLQYVSDNETYYIYAPSFGGNVVRSEKIRFEDSTLTRDLSPQTKVSKGSFDRSGFDTNRLAVVFAPSDQVNNDIYNHMGYLELDDWLGDPQFEFDNQYYELRRFRDEYFKKYQQRYDANALIRLVALYDYTFFEQIKQLVPGRSDLIAGVLLEGDLLSTPKVQITKRPTIENLTYEGILDDPIPSGSGENLYWETSASLKPTLDSKYKYITGSIKQPFFITGSSCHNTGSKGGYKGEIPVIKTPYSGSQDTTQSYIDGVRLNCCYKKVIYHYSGAGTFINQYEKNWYAAVSQSYGWYYSRSLQCTSYQYSEECQSVENRSRFGGTKLEGPGINIPSNYTIDKGPVIEVWEVSPNSLVVDNSPLGGKLIII